MRRALLVLASLIALGAVACLGSDDPEVRVTVNGGTPAGTPLPPGETPTLVPFTPTAQASNLDIEDLHGLTMPIEGACLPSGESLMPNAPREYRNGVHEGVDFYFGDACVVIERGTQVVAAYDGVVIRAQHDYVPLTLEDVERLDAETAAQGASSAETLDIYRGRQVWIDHGNGVITRYCHLDAIVPEIAEGTRVVAGQVVGAVGESGTPESVTAPGLELHLHFEVRIGEGFLGEGGSAEDVRAMYGRLFEPADDASGASGAAGGGG